MRYFLRALQVLIPPLAIFVFFAIVAVSASMVNPPDKLAGPAVRLEGADHPEICSATHIGGGNILTAAHCTWGGPIVVKTAASAIPAEVMWSIDTYDLALLHADGLKMRGAAIDCGLAAPGDLVHIVGNPLGMASVLAYGTVASDLITGELQVDGHSVWKERVLVDMTVAPGDSGGGLFDRANRLIGVVVGMITGYRYAFVVPSSTVCKVLGR